MADSENINKAVKMVREGNISQRKAAEKFKVSRASLQRHLKNNNISGAGRPCALTQVEEDTLAKTINTVTNWGF